MMDIKGTNKNNILENIFHDKLQNGWLPELGCNILCNTGHIFTVGGVIKLCDENVTRCYICGSMAHQCDGYLISEAYCFTLTDSAVYR